ncbi:MAG: hypothetical protein DRJ40_00520 [Thermoprotei archaeon]|nr:MAG: hypothetical protein DRJ40_00520 [Thermoprotei archaeon]
MFKLSKFTLFFPYNENYVLLYNTLTKAIALVTKDLAYALRSGNFNELSKDELNELLSNGFLVEKDIDETKLLIYHSYRSIFNYSYLNLVLHITSACNMSCIYCYEGPKRGLHMDEKVCQNVVKFVKRIVECRGSRNVVTLLHGGEPLLNYRILLTYCREIYKLADEYRLKVENILITNGTLLTKDKIDTISCLVNEVQVTLDGPRDIHDFRRPFIDGKGTFDVILRNVLEIVDRVQTLSIRINVDKQNVMYITKLLDLLRDYGLNRRNVLIGFGRVFVPRVSNGRYNPDWIFSYREFVDVLIGLQKEALRRGFKIVRKIELRPCPALHDNSFAVDERGKIYKCPVFVWDERFAIGNIDDLEIALFRNSFANYLDFILEVPWQKHLGCPYLPMCYAGCTYESIVLKGKINEVCCPRDYFEKLGELLRLYVESRYGDVLERFSRCRC